MSYTARSGARGYGRRRKSRGLREDAVTARPWRKRRTRAVVDSGLAVGAADLRSKCFLHTCYLFTRCF